MVYIGQAYDTDRACTRLQNFHAREDARMLVRFELTCGLSSLT